ncbi:MAG: hypothetical protein HDP34_00980 [Clostridia bacterium]|nr:hypothetical protein [Clostridia bacterium]
MATTKDKKMCFVITPIGDNNTEIRRHIDGIIDQAIVPALGEKYEVVVAHRKYEIGSINDRVIKSIYESDLVIANLTNTNPNVMFELAIRYSFGRPAIVIAEKGTKLPFDVIDENTIFYINDPAGANDLKQSIIEYENNINLDKEEYGPVFKVINKIALYNKVESGEGASSETQMQYIIERLDSLERNISIRTWSKSDKVPDHFRKSDKYRLEFKFESKKPFELKEKDEIRNIFSNCYKEDKWFTEIGNNLFFTVYINKENYSSLLGRINEWIAINEHITYCMYNHVYRV